MTATIRPSRIEIALKSSVPDARGNGVAHAIRTHLGLAVDKVATRDVYTFDAALTAEQIERIRQEFTDPVIQVSAVDRLAAGLTDRPADRVRLAGGGGRLLSKETRRSPRT